MGLIDLKEEKEILKFITGMLKRRGLEPDLKKLVKVHGPHPDMDYQVYIVIANDLKTGESGARVAIYPKSVYWLEDYFHWWKCEPEDKIPIRKETKR